MESEESISKANLQYLSKFQDSYVNKLLLTLESNIPINPLPLAKHLHTSRNNNNTTTTTNTIPISSITTPERDNQPFKVTKQSSSFLLLLFYLFFFF